MRILVLGASGMIGNAVFGVMSEQENWEVFGTVRSPQVRSFFPLNAVDRLVAGIDVRHSDCLVGLLESIHPDVVINCIGLTKHLPDGKDPRRAIPLNALLPHRLAALCALVRARFVHISTDCVYSGEKGQYVESDPPDATDIYGRTKSLGEVFYPHAITIRTSTVGHELQSAHGLLEWFLLQKHHCTGFSSAIFSGLPTVVLAEVIRDVVIPRPELAGLFHVAGGPIAKYDLLHLFARAYGKQIEILRDDGMKIDRSLNAARFREATGYVAPPWPDLVASMFSRHRAEGR